MFYLAVFLFGIIIGSFLNVCIYRTPREETVLHRYSHCPHCRTRLKALDLVPVLSYFLLRGKCRYCSTKISPRYPLIEVFTGLIFLIVYLSMGTSSLTIKYLFLASALIVVTFIDMEHQIIPDKVVLVILAWGIIWQLFWPEILWVNALGGAFLGGGMLLLAAIISKGGMGGGDIKLMFAAGFYLGISHTALALFLGFLSGSIIGIALIVLKIKKRKEPIAFGPFLSLGIFITILWGAKIINTYLQLVGL